MLTLRPTWPRLNANDWAILNDGVVVGRIYEDHAAHLPEGRWFWALNEAAGDAHQAGVRTSGRAATLGGAKNSVSRLTRRLPGLAGAGLGFRPRLTYIGCSRAGRDDRICNRYCGYARRLRRRRFERTRPGQSPWIAPFRWIGRTRSPGRTLRAVSNHTYTLLGSSTFRYCIKEQLIHCRQRG